MAAPKKHVEAWRLERFKTFVADFPDGRIESTEEPDFLVHGANRVVGIELTDLHRETPRGQVPEQAREAMRHRVVARAQELYAKRDLPPVLATFLLDDRILIKKTEVEGLAKEYADLVADNVPAANAGTELPQDYDDYLTMPSLVHKLMVRRFDVVTRSMFTCPGATWVPTLGFKDIERTLASKEPKVSAYRRRCDEVWLVINADMESMATWFEIESSILEHAFHTAFDRVFLVEHFRGKAHELHVTMAASEFSGQLAVKSVEKEIDGSEDPAF